MYYRFRFMHTFGFAFIMIFLMSGFAVGADEAHAESADPAATAVATPQEEKDIAENEAVAVAESHTVLDAQAGYRFISVDDAAGRAAEYEYLHSGPTFGGFANYLSADHKFALEGNFLSDNDFRGELSYDFKGRYRFNLHSDSFFHNLDHERFLFPSFNLFGTSYIPVDADPGTAYGIRVHQDLAEFRYKLPLFPVHVNMGYWRITRKGDMQLRFADHAFDGVTNTLYARTRPIDQQTHEGKFGIDTHLGLFDVIYDFRIRQFGDHRDVPRDFFVDRLSPNNVMQRSGGQLQHDENPDSRFYSHTLRMHTSLSGGIVGAASYTYAKRDNLSTLSDFRGAEQAYTIIHNIAGDFFYTPCHFFSLALKYRRQDVERNGPASLTNPAGYVVNPPVEVRQPLDTVKDTVTLSLMIRPSALFTLKGEYKGEFLSRENMDGWVQPGKLSTIIFPDRSDTHTGSLSLLGRPVKGFKFKTEYRYSTTDHPAYADTYEEKHEGSVQASYNTPNRWGVTGNARFSREDSDHLTIATLDLIAPSQVLQMPRNKKITNATLSLWFAPLEKLTITGSYGLLRSSTDQAVLFASLTPDGSTLTDYTSRAQIYSVQTLYRLNDKLELSLVLQQVRSKAEFEPVSSATVDASGITELTRVDTVESSLAARGNYRFNKNLSGNVEYVYKDYSNNNSYASFLDGSVNSILVSVAAIW